MSDDPYKITFNVTRQKSPQRLVAFSCDDQNIPGDTGFPPSVANEWIQLNFSESQRACLSMNVPNTLQPPVPRFLYMDIGAWCNGQQTFGVLCGNQDKLCKYKYAPGGKPCGSGVNDRGILGEILQCVAGVRTFALKTLVGEHPVDFKHLYIILPDMHVAEPMQDREDIKRPVTGEEGNKRDIFHSAKHVDDLARFSGSGKNGRRSAIARLCNWGTCTSFGQGETAISRS